MLFNSFEFIFAFLPLTFFIYFYLNYKKTFIAAKLFLVGSSLFFYAWWDPFYLPILLSSIGFNYYTGRMLQHIRKNRRIILAFGISANVLLLAYFKYSNFFIENYNEFSNSSIPLLHFTLPLAISFFTFQQIAYLVDSYRGLTHEYNLLNYVLFVSFFPQLIAGPIVHHKQIMPQFSRPNSRHVDYHRIVLGLIIFSIGLFKKVVIADTFSLWANYGFDEATILLFQEAWATSLAFTFQLYFDFSGYTDMAIGSALLFNVRLPKNFMTPYRATNLQAFWNHWHITLSRFLRDYIYIPLGGNRLGKYRTYFNILITFFIGGIWHGAGWMFIFWGLAHGIGLIVLKLWSETGKKLPLFLSWFITFNFVNATWVLFRSENWQVASKIYTGMLGMNGFASINAIMLYSLFAGLSLSLIRLRHSTAFLLTAFTALLFVISIAVLDIREANAFIYFQF